MDSIYDWNEYCGMLEDLESPIAFSEEDAAYHQWLQRETERFDAEQTERFFEILEQPSRG